jgi:hypothetical protein
MIGSNSLYLCIVGTSTFPWSRAAGKKQNPWFKEATSNESSTIEPLATRFLECDLQQKGKGAGKREMLSVSSSVVMIVLARKKQPIFREYSRTATWLTVVKTPLLSELLKNASERSTRNPLSNYPLITPQPLIILTSNWAQFEFHMLGGRVSKRLQGQPPSMENFMKRTC